MPYINRDKYLEYQRWYHKTHKKKSEYNRPGNVAIYCRCGCGEIMWKEDDHGRIRTYISGHNGKGQKITRATVRKMLRRNVMSGVEKRVLHIIQKYNLPYKFVGNGDFLIGRKRPENVGRRWCPCVPVGLK